MRTLRVLTLAMLVALAGCSYAKYREGYGQSPARVFEQTAGHRLHQETFRDGSKQPANVRQYTATFENGEVWDLYTVKDGDQWGLYAVPRGIPVTIEGD